MTEILPHQNKPASSEPSIANTAPDIHSQRSVGEGGMDVSQRRAKRALLLSRSAGAFPRQRAERAQRAAALALRKAENHFRVLYDMPGTEGEGGDTPRPEESSQD